MRKNESHFYQSKRRKKHIDILSTANWQNVKTISSIIRYKNEIHEIISMNA